MSDTFYKLVCAIGRFPFWVSSRPLIVGIDNVPSQGPFLLATTHQSPYDVPLLMRHTPRMLDIVSITEVFRKPFVGWFYGSLNAFPLERSRADPATVRIILDRLARGRVVTLFPEGRLRTGEESVVHSGTIRPGIGRIAKLAEVPVVPCVIINSGAYSKPAAWLPFGHTRYAIAYGQAIAPTDDPGDLESQLVAAFRSMHRSLHRQSGVPANSR
jgi:1-acyl-sn-glycerol-3-phosphate acyltransferase